MPAMTVGDTRVAGGCVETHYALKPFAYVKPMKKRSQQLSQNIILQLLEASIFAVPEASYLMIPSLEITVPSEANTFPEEETRRLD